MNTIVPPCGFNNTGALCYANSLMQALLSCRYAIKELIETGNAEDMTPIRLYFIKNLQRLIDGQSVPEFTSQVLHELSQYSIAKHLGSGQQSASEFFILLIDKLKLDYIFEHRYHVTTTCRSCGHILKNKDSGVQFNMFLDEPGINYATDLAREIMLYKIDLSYYKCDKCGLRDTSSQVREIRMLPDILVILFNKYKDKKDYGFPSTLTFEGNVRPLHYNVVACIEHYGSLNGGHYICNAYREGYGINAFNDTSVSNGQLHSTSNTYVVFYEKIYENR